MSVVLWTRRSMLLAIVAVTAMAAQAQGGTPRTRFETALTRTAAAPAAAKGKAKAEIRGARRKFNFEAENLRRIAGATLTIQVKRGATTTNVGRATVSALGVAKLELENGGPAVQVGDTVCVLSGSTLILSGKF